MARILILEDNDDCAKVIKAILAHRGYEVLTATVCSEVQEHLARNRVDALIIDLFLSTQPCHGTDVALMAQRAHGAVKILFVSGTPLANWSETDKQKLARLAEASWDALQKPFTATTLVLYVRELLSRTPSKLLSYPGCLGNRDCPSLSPSRAGLTD